MKLEAGKLYRTRNGALVELEGAPNASGAMRGVICRSGLVKFSSLSWMANGRRFLNEESPNDLVEEDVPLYRGWMCQVGDEIPMPAPTEEIARKWAKISNGRAFRVLEIIE